MSDITISYKGNSIATMDATGTKTLLTEGKYCEDDIEVAYVKPGGGGGSGVQSGTVTPASNSKTMTITLSDANISHLVIAETDFNAGEAGANWFTMAVLWENGVVASLIRYNDSTTLNSNYANSSLSINGNTLSCTVNYNFRSAKTYNWYAW